MVVVVVVVVVAVAAAVVTSGSEDIPIHLRPQHTDHPESAQVIIINTAPLEL